VSDITERSVSGKRLVIVGLMVVLAITAYVMVRIVQVSGPGPDPDSIPQRPEAGSTP